MNKYYLIAIVLACTSSAIAGTQYDLDYPRASASDTDKKIVLAARERGAVIKRTDQKRKTQKASASQKKIATGKSARKNRFKENTKGNAAGNPVAATRGKMQRAKKPQENTQESVKDNYIATH